MKSYGITDFDRLIFGPIDGSVKKIKSINFCNFYMLAYILQLVDFPVFTYNYTLQMGYNSRSKPRFKQLSMQKFNISQIRVSVSHKKNKNYFSNRIEN